MILTELCLFYKKRLVKKILLLDVTCETAGRDIPQMTRCLNYKRKWLNTKCTTHFSDF